MRKRATSTSSDALEKETRNQLVSLREMKKTQVEDYFNTIQNQVLTFSNDAMIIEAMEDFKSTFYKVKEEAFPLNSDMETYRQKLGQYYVSEFGEEYKKQNKGKTIDANGLLKSIDTDAVALQYQFIQTNANPLGSKDALRRLVESGIRQDVINL